MNDITNANETTAAATATPLKPKLTHAEKILARATFLTGRIESDTIEYGNLVTEINSAEALKNVDVGSVIQIKLGRKFADKDTTRVVQANVIGVRVEDDGAKQYKVQHGEGFDAEVAVVTAASIVGVVS